MLFTNIDTCEAEARLAVDTVEAAVAASRNLDVGEQFHVTVNGFNEFPGKVSGQLHATLSMNLAEYAQRFGLRLEFLHGDVAHFTVHAKQS